MSEQEKERRRIYDLLNADKKLKKKKDSEITGVFFIIFTQPLRSGRIWHKGQFFKQSLTCLNSEFSFS